MFPSREIDIKLCQKYTKVSFKTSDSQVSAYTPFHFSFTVPLNVILKSVWNCPSFLIICKNILAEILNQCYRGVYTNRRGGGMGTPWRRENNSAPNRGSPTFPPLSRQIFVYAPEQSSSKRFFFTNIIQSSNSGPPNLFLVIMLHKIGFRGTTKKR